MPRFVVIVADGVGPLRKFGEEHQLQGGLLRYLDIDLLGWKGILRVVRSRKEHVLHAVHQPVGNRGRVFFKVVRLAVDIITAQRRLDIQDVVRGRSSACQGSLCGRRGTVLSLRSQILQEEIEVERNPRRGYLRFHTGGQAVGLAVQPHSIGGRGQVDHSGVSAVPVGVGFKQRLDSFFPDQQAVLFDNGIFCEYFENSFVALHGVIDVYFDIGHSSVIESVSATLPVVVGARIIRLFDAPRHQYRKCRNAGQQQKQAFFRFHNSVYLLNIHILQTLYSGKDKTLCKAFCKYKLHTDY